MPAGKKILLVAYYFPPLGMGGVGRPLNLFQYLPEFGYEVEVLTVKDILYPQYDKTLLSPTDKSRVHRTGSLDPSRLLHLMGKRAQARSGLSGSRRPLPLYLPDPKRGWNPFAWRKARRLIKMGEYAAVITTVPPPSSLLLGLRLKTRFDIPWVADFRDYWFLMPIDREYGPGTARDYAVNLQKETVHRADAIVTVNRHIAAYLGRGEVIHNAASDELMESWRRAKPESSRFTVGALGTFNDLFPFEPLMRLASDLRDKLNLANDAFSIRHVGHVDDSMRRLCDKYNLKEFVEFGGYCPRTEAIERLAGVDLLYLAVNPRDSCHVLPGRLFDYLISGKPILGLVAADSEVADLINAGPSGRSFDPDDLDGAAVYLQGMYEKKRSGDISGNIGAYDYKQFTGQALARKYASLLDGLLK